MSRGLLIGLFAWVLGVPTGALADVGQGTLRALSPDRTVLGDCPLEHTDVEVEVSGSVARARVTQRFSNPFPERIEAVYVFPLPESAAVRHMEMRIGDRLVRADIERRQAAQERYEAARNAGQTASLLEQERPNIFTTSVANIRPGHPVEVTLEYVDTLEYEDGLYHLAYPMTVGPRFIPGTPTGAQGTGYAPDTDRVSDASRITPPVAPTGRSGHDISVAVNLDAGVAMGLPDSPSHDVVVTRRDPRRARIELSPRDSIPNRDFLLEWPVSPERITSGVLTHRPDAEEAGYAMLMVHPNPAPPVDEITPKEIVFVLDTSGSMYGQPMDLSKALMRRLIRELHPRDTFSVLRYSDSASSMSALPLENTAANRRRALAFIESLEGEGGTDALGGVRAAFAYPRDASKLRVVVFLTDGYIGNESEVLAEIQANIGDARLFGFGVGSSVNRYLLEEMGRVGRGTTRIVTPREDAEGAVGAFFKRLQSPYLTDVRVDWGDLAVSDTYPQPIPDLFAGQPLTVLARYGRPGRGTVTVRGRLAGEPYEQALEVTLPERRDDHGAVASLWARRRIADLGRQMYAGETPELVEEVTQVALTHRLVSQYTSFVAVENRVVEEVDAQGRPRTVVVPVELPEGVSADRLFDSSLSLARFQPGDPELRVDAPSNAQRVVAVFPFGDTHELSFEPRIGRWTTRFLVPRDTPEGNYTIAIVVTLADGSVEHLREGYTVDASAPEVDLEVIGDLRAGSEVRIEARQRFTDEDRALHGRRRRVEILSDIARLRVRLSTGEPVQLRLVEPGYWAGTLILADDVPRDLSVQVTSYDVAGNRGEQEFPLGVAP